MGRWSYSVVIDAGSSGSRVYVYKWPKLSDARRRGKRDVLSSLPAVESKKHWHKKIKPGIATFGDDPSRVGHDYLKDLLDFALEIVGEDNAAETPVFLLATAGMRLLPTLQGRALLGEICSYTKSNYDFALPDCDSQIQIISGDAEGLYGWVAANYLLGGFDAKAHNHGKGHHTYGFLDMGGASAQIAFAPNSTEAQRHANDLKLLRMRSVDGSVSEYQVYVTTWLEFGVNEARRRYVEQLVDHASPVDGEYPDPCLPNGLTISTKGEILTPDKIKGEERYLVGTGQFSECMRSAFPLLGKDKPCTDDPCLLNGVHAPAIDFDINHFVGVSEYWHTTHGVFESKHSDKAYDFKTYQDKVQEFCTQDWHSIEKGVEAQKWGKDVTAALAAETCFKASWVINVLHDGIGIPRVGLEHTGDGHNGTDELLEGAKEVFPDAFQAADKIDGTEISWTLGKAVLYAASEVPAINTNTLPVGFGSNNGEDIPSDWSFGGLRKMPPAFGSPLGGVNETMTNEEDDSILDSWHDSLFSDSSPRRVPGLVLFLVILCIVVFFMCGKDRRNRFFQRIMSGLSPGGARPLLRRSLNPFSAAFGKSVHHGLGHRSTSSADRDHMMESGGLLDNLDDYELNGMEGGNEEMDGFFLPDDASSSGGSITTRAKKGRSSGWATPTMRLPQGAGGNAAEVISSTGLLGRTESRDRLSGLIAGGLGAEAALQSRNRSRRTSPTRLRSPMMTPLAED